MTVHLPWLGLSLLCALASCTRNDALGSSQAPPMNNVSARVGLPFEGRLPSFDAATAWLNSKPLTAPDLHGKVVLVQFWTYSCINWRRTMPYIRAWSEKYAAFGLVVIGVHTPEFDFEEESGNVSAFVRDTNMTFPIAVDNERGIWRTFNNEYWPALYFVDAAGQVRHHQFGEGEYERAESVIQELLSEAGKVGVPRGLVSVAATGAELAAAWAHLRSPENYLGYERTQNFASPGGASARRGRVYPDPPNLPLNYWALSGDWTMGRESARLIDAGGRIAYRFQARDLHLVMGAAASADPARFRVRIDGRPPGAAHGVDVDEHGNGTVGSPGMYQLIRQPEPIVERDFEIEFLDAPVEAFSFTFG